MEGSARSPRIPVETPRLPRTFITRSSPPPGTMAAPASSTRAPAPNSTSSSAATRGWSTARGRRMARCSPPLPRGICAYGRLRKPSRPSSSSMPPTKAQSPRCAGGPTPAASPLRATAACIYSAPRPTSATRTSRGKAASSRWNGALPDASSRAARRRAQSSFGSSRIAPARSSTWTATPQK